MAWGLAARPSVLCVGLTEIIHLAVEPALHLFPHDGRAHHPNHIMNTTKKAPIHYTLRFSIKAVERDERGTSTAWSLWDAQEQKFSEQKHTTFEGARDHFLEVQAHFAKRAAIARKKQQDAAFNRAIAYNRATGQHEQVAYLEGQEAAQSTK